MQRSMADSGQDVGKSLMDELARNFSTHDSRIQKRHFDVLEHMRSEGPVHYAESHGGHWVVVGYEEVREAASSPDRFSSAGGVVLGAEKALKFKPIELNPPEQHPWRRLLASFFTQRAADTIVEPMKKYADSLIDEFITSGRADVVETYAKPMQNHSFFRVLMNFSAEQTQSCFAYGIWDDREGLPADGGFVDAVRTAEIDGASVTRDEFAGWLMLMISGGADTTPFAIGKLFVHLAQHPGVRHRARGNPEFLHKTIDESLRQQSPAVSIMRTAAKDFTFGGKDIREGDKILLLVWPGANRDPALCPRADDFDPDRSATKHVAFGAGVHRCVGERHARAVLAVAAERFLERIPDFDLDPHQSLDYRMGQSRGPVTVPLLFSSDSTTKAGA